MAAEPVTQAPRQRPGGRSARVRAAVHRATEELLAEGGREAATIPAIAERAGVHPTTVYRRWTTVEDLLLAVALGRLTGEIVVPDTGSLRGDLRRWAQDVRTDVADPDVLVLLRTVIGAPGEPIGACACLEDRRDQLAAMLEHERARGGEPPALDDLVDGLLGPIYFRALFSTDALPAARVDALVTAALAAQPLLPPR